MPLPFEPDLLVETLSTITELSIGLAGFSGVAAAFMQRSSAVSELDRMRITFNICISLIPGFAAFLTLSLINAGLDQITVIRWGSSTIVAVLLTILALSPVIKSRAGNLQRFNPVALSIFVLAIVVNLPLQLYNSIVMPVSAAGIFVGGLSMILLVGAANFAGLLWQMLGYKPAQAQE
jgi:hypothetical protein